MLDVLFVVETWYVGYQGCIATTAAIAHTPKPLSRPGCRHTGGVCALGSNKARSMMSSAPEVTDSSVTVTLKGTTVTGIYMPPSMNSSDVKALLASLESRDVVLGDVNVRYNQRTGLGNPDERAASISSWMQAAGMLRLDPTTHGRLPDGFQRFPHLTIDHCFAKRPFAHCNLHLVDTAGLDLSTDHKYLLLLDWTSATTLGHPNPKLPRFQNSRLGNEHVATKLATAWTEAATACLHPLDRSYDIDDQHGRIVKACQQACRRALGECKPNSQGKRTCSEPTYFQMVRQLFRLDKDNSLLCSSDPDISALDEAARELGKRYQAPYPISVERSARPSKGGDFEPLTIEEVGKELSRQDSSKACGSDGIHVRAVKALADTSLLPALTHLFNSCLDQGYTPAAWNATDIQLIVKDPRQPKTVFNTRPIALSTTFRKLFESCLLRRMLHMPQMQLHPAQAGFRSDYSTLTHAAVVHIALEQRLCAGAIFLDFSAAFDMVNHTLLDAALMRRECPRRLLEVLRALRTGLTSRVLANGGASPWFERTRGVLQGSPLSPLLWNILVDDLLYDLNPTNSRLPKGLFYADDGALLYSHPDEIRGLLGCIWRWCHTNGISVNIRKCGHVSITYPGPIGWDKDILPGVDQYTYLGFPITANGIDFQQHLDNRIERAVGRVAFMTRHSATWGVANRLRAYYEYVAPILEYGAPLVWAWALRSESEWKITEDRYKALIQWIANGKHGWCLTQTLLGLPKLSERFECLHMSFLFRLQRSERETLLQNLLLRPMAGGGFRRSLRENRLLTLWKRETNALTAYSLAGFQRKWVKKQVAKRAQRSHLTRLVALALRSDGRKPAVDPVLTAPRHMQDQFFQYRRGVWCFRYRHACTTGSRGFRRGDEDCDCQCGATRFSRRQRREKGRQAKLLDLDGCFTNVDFMLNNGYWEQAFEALGKVKAGLREEFTRDNVPKHTSDPST